MRTTDQDRARMAWDHIEQVKKSGSDKKYGTLARKIATMIRSAGLCQAVHFLNAKGKGEHGLILGHLAKQLQRLDPAINAENFAEKVRKADTPAYMSLTREALACAKWYSRAAEAELGADATGD